MYRIASPQAVLDVHLVELRMVKVGQSTSYSQWGGQKVWKAASVYDVNVGNKKEDWMVLQSM